MLTEKLARYVTDAKLTDIPHDVLAGARDALIDTVGVALAGTLEPVAEIAVRWVNELGARPQATVWGQNISTSPAEAAFANGISAHALDFDDSLPSLRGHPSATMVPAALAVAEATRASGAQVLAAYALGLEIAGKLGRAVGQDHYLRGWHSTATIGAFSATAAAARLWGLDAAQLQAAWGLAASQMSGLVRNFGTMAKPFHAGHAARTGVLSAWMAREGFTTDTAIFEGERSVLDTYGGEDGVALGELIERLGRPWEMTEPGIYVKRWPCCYCNHRPIGGLIELLKKHAVKADEVQGISVGFPPGADNALVSHNPGTGLEGKFSIEYVAAALVLDGKVTLETFTDAMVQRPAVRALMAKTRRYRIEDKGVYSGVVGYNDVAIATRRGTFEMRVDRVPGSPAWLMTASDRIEKFMDCSGRVLGQPGSERLLGQLQRCAELADLRELVAATVPPSHATGAAKAAAMSAK
ncbi:MAG: MmgE/PrpD family protein [Betaproteobacteria bacterium]|nr:MmgE/PrpD family protein [Betaproteobacteria bacterium]